MLHSFINAYGVRVNIMLRWINSREKDRIRSEFIRI